MSETETTETPVKTGKKRFNVKDVCEFYGVDYEKAAALPWADRNELINRHYDKQALVRKTKQVERLRAQAHTISLEADELNLSVMRFDQLLAAIK